MKNRFIRLLFFLILFGLFVSLLLLLSRRIHQPDLAFDPSPDNVVIYADIQPFPGGPPPDQPCLGRYFPRLRIWGDGLVFLDISQAGHTGQGSGLTSLPPNKSIQPWSCLTIMGCSPTIPRDQLTLPELRSGTEPTYNQNQLISLREI